MIQPNFKLPVNYARQSYRVLRKYQTFTIWYPHWIISHFHIYDNYHNILQQTALKLRYVYLSMICRWYFRPIRFRQTSTHIFFFFLYKSNEFLMTIQFHSIKVLMIAYYFQLTNIASNIAPSKWKLLIQIDNIIQSMLKWKYLFNHIVGDRIIINYPLMTSWITSGNVLSWNGCIVRS